MDTLKNVNDMTYDELKAHVLQLERKATLDGGIRISTKGAVSVYSIGRFPVTLYAEQWLALDKRMVHIREFIAANVNNPLMAVKPPKEAKAA